MVLSCSVKTLANLKLVVIKLTQLNYCVAGKAEELCGVSEVDLTKLYLARFSDQDWHRVKPIAHSTKVNCPHNVTSCLLEPLVRYNYRR